MRWLRRIGIGVAAVLGLAAVALAVIWFIADRRAARRFDVALVPIRAAAPGDRAALERGRRLAVPIGKCVDCHRDDFGGTVFIDDPALGRIVAPNLTAGRGGILGHYDDAHFARAVRNGIGAEGRPLMFMPSFEFHAMSDEDISALIAYVRQQPRINNILPASHLGPLGRILSVTGSLPLYDADRIDQTQRPPQRVAAGPTVAYGRYLAQVSGCTGCHGPGLSGGRVPGAPPSWPPAANLTPIGMRRYNLASFTIALRRGRRPDGSAIDSVMPWRLTRGMTDEELQALWGYLQTVPPRPSGQR